MRNPLYISNDMLPFEIDGINYIRSFHPSSDEWNYDKYVSEKLKEESLNNKGCDCIVLPFSLDRERYASFLGLVVAMHIRLTPEWGFSRKPIIFIGPDPIEQVARISPYGTMLFTPGIFCISVKTRDELENKLKEFTEKSEEKELSDKSYKDFLNRIKVTPPAMYDTRHSIANAWCRNQWTNLIGGKPNSRDIGLSHSLYFKYNLQSGNFSVSNPNIDQLLPRENYEIDNSSSKILIIDDESDEWRPFFTKIFSTTEPDHLHFIGDDFKNLKRKEIIGQSIKEIIDFDPDIILLDLRLSIEDSTENDPKKFTGAQIISQIKNENDDINKGIQVILFSASNKRNSYADLDYDGIVIKDSPETHSNESFPSMVDSIKNLISRAEFQKTIFNKINNIRNFLDKSIIDKDKQEDAKDYLDIAWSLSRILDEQKSYTQKYLSLSYLPIYNLIELFVNQHIEIKNSGFYVRGSEHDPDLCVMEKVSDKEYYVKIKYYYDKHNNYNKHRYIETTEWEKINNCDWKSVDLKMAAVLKFRFNVNIETCREWDVWSIVRDTRNQKSFAHSGGQWTPISKKDFYRILDFTIYLIAKRDLNVFTNSDYDLFENENKMYYGIVKKSIKHTVNGDTTKYYIEYPITKYHLEIKKDGNKNVILKEDELVKFKPQKEGNIWRAIQVEPYEYPNG